MTIEIRRVVRNDADALRKVRLAALADAPSAFGSTYADEVERPPQMWEERAATSEVGVDGATFFAVDGDEVVGLVAGFRDPDRERESDIELVSMWVAPSHRRSGASRLLVDAVIDWAEGVGAERVLLWVTRGNEPAERLYRSLGFEPTGDVAPLPSNPCKDELRMVRELVLAAG